MKTVIIAEKPSVGKDIARVLGCKPGSGGCPESPQYIVTWALGHLVTLAEPEDYDKAYKNWDINHLPIMPDKLKLVVIPQTAKQYHTVKEQLLRKDVDGVIIATDAGREGELVARWIIEKAGCRKPIKRLWISSVTDKAIRDGFQNLKDGKRYERLGESAKARAEADWLVGINATRCLTTKYNSPLSCGRVQTPTVAIIVKREEEIRRFVPVKYYGITGSAGSFTVTWTDTDGSAPGNGGLTRCFDRERAEKILSKLTQIANDATVAEVNKTVKRKFPPRLYDLTELQRDASKRFGYSPKETLSIMQRLYEEHKALTYPRTDSRYISTDIVPTLPERIKACAAQPYAKLCAQALRSPIRPSANYVDNAKVSDHHAVIPTEQSVNIRDLNEKERRIYDLVVMRFLAVFFPPYEYEQTALKITLGGETFTAHGRVVLAQGFNEVYQGADTDDEDEDEDGGQTLPGLKKGDKLKITGLRITEGKTGPPAPFNEATLLSAMESPAKYMDKNDKGLADTLTQTGGLGTVATRADIIEKLFDNFMIEKKGKDIFSTSKARQLLQLVPKELKSPALTGAWEQKLAVIADGSLGKDIFLREIRNYTAEIIRDIKNSTETFRHDNLSTTRCPECGKFMLQVTGKKGEMLVCQDRECNTRVNVSFQIKSKCPHCHKFLKMTGEGEKRMIVCACGYREKYAAFEKRKQAERDTLSKRDVQTYLENQNKQEREERNNPFAALKGMKFE